MPTNDTMFSIPQESAQDQAAYVNNIFNRTPESQWYAKRAATKAVPAPDNRVGSVDAALAHAYEQFSAEPKVADEETRAMIQRVYQTNRLLAWFRDEASGGRS